MLLKILKTWVPTNLWEDNQPLINPLQPSVAFLYPLKTLENLQVSEVFREYRKATPGCNGFIYQL